MSSVDATLNERGARYGSFESHARITQAINLLGSHEGAEKLAEAKRYGACAEVIEEQARVIDALRAQLEMIRCG
jgi:hypothetical protein